MKFLVLSFSILLFLLCVNPSHAHTSDEEGAATVLMHSEPNDRPLANQKTIIHFQISDSSNNFQLEKCNCSVTISQNNAVLYTNSVIDADSKKSLYNAYSEFVFPKAGTYEVFFSGKPIGEESFEPFEAHFSLNVGEKVIKPRNSLGIPSYLTYMILILIGSSTVFLLYKRISS